ncbi:hypothetical protein XA68_17557 [Ophiocordyceps unilateralis]|uniref:non-specific serine/threonine protein kinase n=1 Tax=Ophiocordyceps unilateralis TaxID=268505 RepID=A0A2A9P4M6_OPHUN|nr:hypothetical protein XA68_17557 [Ophiocordyceps unilateralis]
MGDGRHGWTTVGPGIPNQCACEAEQELREREAIAAWSCDDHWPGIDKPPRDFDAKRFDARLIKLDDLGKGGAGCVDKVVYDAVALARKRIVRPRGRTIDDLRQEGLTMAKLDHRHVVKLVATYAPRAFELCLLIWPAAVCSLTVLLDDVEALRVGDGDADDIVGRLTALGLRSDDQSPLDFLAALLGCVARAMAYCHAQGVRHLDIKPHNILLKPDRVYLADFGISRDVSGQDHTTIDDVPGTEKWRAPELCSEHGSSMQLSDMYSLGLVFLNIATVLYGARLADFEDAMRYSPRLSLRDRRRVREDKIKRHLGRLTDQARVIPRFIFTHEGQETVRPRPIVSLISHMVTSNPRSRLSAEKVDEKLSTMGGIHQIYHADCCKRPVAWVEDKWDRKLTDLASLKAKNEQQLRRIRELEGKDETYEARIDSARKAHEHDIATLQALLRDAENKCHRLELEKATRRNLHGHGAHSRPAVPGPRRQGPSTSVKPRPAPPSCQPSQQRKWTESPESWTVGAETVVPPPPRRTHDAIGLVDKGQRSPGPLTEYRLRSRGSGSKLPLPVTPGRGDATPVLNFEHSMTDSSMTSSVFSRRSVETAPTPTDGSPQLYRRPPAKDEQQPQRQHKQWTELPPRQRDRRAMPSRPVLSMTSSAMSSPRALQSEPTSRNGGALDDSTARPVIPSLQPAKSWADVAKLEE